MPALPSLCTYVRALVQRHLRELALVNGPSYPLRRCAFRSQNVSLLVIDHASRRAATTSSCSEAEQLLNASRHSLEPPALESVPNPSAPQDTSSDSPCHNLRRGGPISRSRRRKKVLRPSPSLDLIRALGEKGWLYVPPSRYAHKVDLSYLNARLRWPRWGRWRSIPRPGSRNEAAKITLQSILARFLSTPAALLTMNQAPTTYDLPMVVPDIELDSYHFSMAELTLLRSKGYNSSDVKLWAVLLTTTDLFRSLRQLRPSHGISSELNRGRLPTFLILLLLRRTQINLGAFTLLLSHAQALFHPKGLEDKAQETGKCAVEKAIDDNTAMITVVRLIRHARRVWPRTLPAITSLLTAHINGQEAANANMSSRRLSYLAFICNRVLSLLSLRTSLDPLRTIDDQIKAQFHILRLMADHRPPLVVTQEGFRAVIGTQLARPKTAAERQWADLKSTSWPPWKAAKTGIDVDKGVELGRSGASLAIRRMQEAGYGMERWDMVAQILAGWNTDGSPTIQTRSILPSRSGGSSDGALPNTVDATSDADDHPRIWAARIKATRTVEEAWACFLQFQDCQVNAALEVYSAMFEKLGYDAKRRRRPQEPPSGFQKHLGGAWGSTVLPGDGKEVVAAPNDPHEAIYIPSSPPTIEHLFDRMVGSGIQPTGHCLENLLHHATSLHLGLKYLSASTIAQDATIFSNFSRSPDDLGKLARIPDQVFTAFIRLLCRFPSKIASPTVRDPWNSGIEKWRNQIRGNLMHAFEIVSARKTQHRATWNVILVAFAREDRGITLLSPGVDPSINAIQCYKIMQDIRRRMRELDVDLDAEGFQLICRGLVNATIASLKLKGVKVDDFEWTGPFSTPLGEAEGQDSTLFKASKEAEDVLSRGALFIKGLFQNLVGTTVHVNYKKKGSQLVPLLSQLDEDTKRALPRLLVVPPPAELHVYVRALGFLSDYYGIKQLLVWMIEYKDEVQTVANELHNGSRMLRRTLIAMRVFLEQRWKPAPHKGGKRITETVRELMDGVEEWGGWPSDEEVEEYCLKARFHELFAPSKKVEQG